MQNIVKMFPDVFEIESADRKWYETLGMCQEEVEIDSKVLDLASIEYAMTKVHDPLEHTDALDEIIDNFKSGASWFLCNKPILEKLSMDERIKAEYIAVRMYARKVCGDIESIGNWTVDDVHNFCYIIENDYCSGFMWAMTKDDGGMSLEISMVKQILESTHKCSC